MRSKLGPFFKKIQISILVLHVIPVASCTNDKLNAPGFKRDKEGGATTQDQTAKPVVAPETSGEQKPSDDSLPPPPPMEPNAPLPVGMEQSEGCTAANELPEGPHTFAQGSYTRSYTIRKPASYTKAQAWPVVLALHPNGGKPDYWDGLSGERALRKVFGDKVILVMAKARVDDWRGDLPTELEYFDKVLTRVKKELCINPTKIFSMGFSGGGSFSGVLGCQRSDIRAIASGGAVIYFDPKICIGKPSAWVTIGDGEAGKDRTAFRDYWKTSNLCSDETKTLTPKTCVAYACPDPGRGTEFCSHAGGHEWPSFGTQNVWKFFSQF